MLSRLPEDTLQGVMNRLNNRGMASLGQAVKSIKHAKEYKNNYEARMLQPPRNVLGKNRNSGGFRTRGLTVERAKRLVATGPLPTGEDVEWMIHHGVSPAVHAYLASAGVPYTSKYLHLFPLQQLYVMFNLVDRWTITPEEASRILAKKDYRLGRAEEFRRVFQDLLRQFPPQVLPTFRMLVKISKCRYLVNEYLLVVPDEVLLRVFPKKELPALLHEFDFLRGRREFLDRIAKLGYPLYPSNLAGKLNHNRRSAILEEVRARGGPKNTPATLKRALSQAIAKANSEYVGVSGAFQALLGPPYMAKPNVNHMVQAMKRPKRGGHANRMIQDLKAHGAHMTQNARGRTALHLAVRGYTTKLGRKQPSDELLRMIGGNARNVRNHFGKTPRNYFSPKNWIWSTPTWSTPNRNKELAALLGMSPPTDTNRKRTQTSRKRARPGTSSSNSNSSSSNSNANNSRPKPRRRLLVSVG